MEGLARIGVLYAIGLASCGPLVAYPSEGEDTTTGDPASGPGTTITTTSSSSSPTTTGQSTTSTSTSDDDPTTSADFIETPDYPPGGWECDLWTGEPCAEGEKCMPYSNDGSHTWNATKCSPIAEDPAAPGEPCTVQENGVSGIDDCEAFSMCWNVDPETNTGTCVAFCTGSEANPTCDDPCTECNLTGSGVLILCLPRCDPLAQDCARGNACYPVQDHFVCAPDASGDLGNAGDPCEYLNVCDPGLFCANADSVDGCEGSQGCCAPFCTVGAADPCPGLGPNTECIPYYENPPPPSQCQSEDIGVCVVPG